MALTSRDSFLLPQTQCCSADGDGIMSYVGNNKGEWVAETTYKYVGKGMGEFNVGSSPEQQSSWNWCHYVGALAVCVLVAFLGILLWPVDGTTTTTTTAKHEAPVAPRFNCSEGISHWELGWSAAKKRWCCDEDAHRGCPSSPSG
mmetsp:Transcript_88150/g.254384  ORF Transcript_88150/g.254384 Transcript_88150/m.254384 type:complete len:145 (-) Transcript_88150:110-544(-)